MHQPKTHLSTLSHSIAPTDRTKQNTNERERERERERWEGKEEDRDKDERERRRKGLFKKAHQLHCLTGAHIASIVFSPAGWPFVYGDPSFDATIDRYLKIKNTNSSITGNGAASSSTSCVKEEMINGGGDDDGVEANNKRMMMLRSCLEGLRVEDYWKVDELVEMKEKMEVIRGKVVEQIENEVVKSYLCHY